MKLSEFIVLSEQEKRVTVLQEGVALAQRDVSTYLVFLFQLPLFYVELYCCKQSKAIFEYKAFYNPGHLNPYLDAIPIDGLFNT